MFFSLSDEMSVTGCRLYRATVIQISAELEFVFAHAWRRYSAASQAKADQIRMVVRTAAQRPEELAVSFLDRQVVDARVAVHH